MTLAWLTLISVKAGLIIASAILFWRVSWHWWPARLFALEAELPAIHRRFRLGAACMLVLVGLTLRSACWGTLFKPNIEVKEANMRLHHRLEYRSSTPSRFF